MISVLMPVFNAEAYFLEAVKSILVQTYRNFELIIVDDASTDSSAAIVHKLKDRRIRYLKNKENIGVAKSLNYGLQKAKGKYIARMDADDIAERNRLEKQVAFLETHPRVGILGTRIILIGKTGKKLGDREIPVEDTEIKKELAFRNPLIHSTVIFRKSLVDKYGGYDENLNGAEDYDLWLRLGRFVQIRSLPESLLRYRLDKKSISFTEIRRVEKAFVKAKIKSVFSYGYPFWHLLFLIKSFFLLFIPSFLRRKVYEAYFGY